MSGEASDEEPASPIAREATTAQRNPVTVVGLFEDRIDAEHALVALRRVLGGSDEVSLLVRVAPRSTDEAEAMEAVARALVANALEAVGGWLQGLVSLIVPERGTYLVAGPLGAALAGIRVDDDPAGNGQGVPPASPEEGVSILHTFMEFGFGQDEATYLEHRLAAGAVILAITSDQPRVRQLARRLFADYNAVHIGQARTDARLAAEASALLAAPPEQSQSGDLVVADAVADLRRLCGNGSGHGEAEACGSDVIDAEGLSVGTVTDLLADAVERGKLTVRYVVVGFGGLFGLGRHHVAIPVELTDLRSRPVRLAPTRETVHHAPRFDPGAPFSRRPEAAICAYFGTKPYWTQ